MVSKNGLGVWKQAQLKIAAAWYKTMEKIIEHIVASEAHCELVGGPCDGLWMFIDERLDHLKMPVRVAVDFNRRHEKGGQILPVKSRVALYQRIGPDRFRFVGVEDF
ncbi:MAG: hypothetical protein NXI32_22155 [bacterium]|nr:hypothetical protein [bacterium]